MQLTKPRTPCIRWLSLGQRTRRLLSTRPINGLSAVQGSSEPPLDTRTLSRYFTEELLTKRAYRLALQCPRECPRPHGGPISRNLGINNDDHGYLSWDFAELDSNVAALAKGLVGLGVKKGDRVAVVMGNCRFVSFADSLNATEPQGLMRRAV